MVVAVVTIFFLLFAMSFAVGPVPHGQKRFSREWAAAWFKTSLPRMLIAGGFAGALFVASSLSSDNNNRDSAQAGSAACMRELPPLSDVPVTAARIGAAADNLRLVADAAERGDLAMAQTLFFGETHNLTHDIDPPLRTADEPLATNLCDSILTLETQLPSGTNLGLIQASAEAGAEQLDRARDVLNGLQ